MHIAVLLKQTFDTEEKIFITDQEVSEDGVKFIINPYDEYALEEAIRLKEAHGGTVTAVSVGPDRHAEALRTALAIGADEAVLIQGEGIGADGAALAKTLAAYLKSDSFDLILGGFMSVDDGSGQVAIRVAGLLGLPHVGAVTSLSVDPSAGLATAERDAEGDTETVEVTLPALITAQQGLNDPRYPSLPGIMKAKKKPLRRLTLDDLGLTPAETEAKTVRVALELPPARSAGRRLAGAAAEQAAALVRLLRKD